MKCELCGRECKYEWCAPCAEAIELQIDEKIEESRSSWKVAGGNIPERESE